MIFEYFCSKRKRSVFMLKKIMIQLLTYPDIDPQQWQALVETSAVATWFQTKEAYEFYSSLPQEMTPFAVAIQRTNKLVAVCVGYITQAKNKLVQCLTCRAIIIGGPVIDEDATAEEITALLNAVKKLQRSDLQPVGRSTAKRSTGLSPIYFETRNFHDYSRWKEVFQNAGFTYQPHLNFHVDTTQPWETIENNIGKHRRKYIRLSYRDGVEVELDPTLQQVKEYYAVLQDLYRTKVKMPLQPWSFFERLYHMPSCKYLLVMYNNQVVGGSICMTLKNHGVYEWYACGKDGMYRNIHPSSVTKHIGMKYAADNGYKVFDMMGAGKPNEPYGVRDFKAEFGGKLVEHGRYLYVRKPMLYWIGTIGVKILKKLK